MFKKKSMRGVGGYTPWSKTILLDINPTTEGWKEGLKYTIAHEYNHTAYQEVHSMPETLGETLVFEGLADCFAEHVCDVPKPLWTQSVSPKGCKEYLSTLETLLISEENSLYKDVFFGSKDYPQWLGYSLGYNVVKSYLQNTTLSWGETMGVEPKTILEESTF